MPGILNKKTIHLFQLICLSSLVVFGFFAWQGAKGFNLWDGGFLWYGVQRTMLGEVPIRDFMAYDPGRYYWSAWMMEFLGNNGIMALRGTVSIFQALGLFTGLALISQSKKHGDKYHLFFMVVSAIILIVWMFPPWKIFDISLSIFMISALAFLVRNPSANRLFFTGLCLGAIAVFGRNHGIYGLMGSLGVLVWLGINQAKEGPGLIKGAILWGAGVAVGFAPILLMVFLVPDFFSAFWDSIRFLFEMKNTNIPLPIPWPWQVDWMSAPFNIAGRQAIVGFFFIGLILFGLISLAWIFWRRIYHKPVSPVLAAAAFMALPYAHHAYSRADVNHLAQSIFPMLIGLLAVLVSHSGKIRWPFTLLLAGASFWVMLPVHPGWQSYMSKKWESIEISGNTLEVSPNTAGDIRLIRELVNIYAPNGENILVVPFWPGVYPLVEKQSPMWENYALFPRSNKFEKEEIKRIIAAKPAFVLILDYLLDGREELLFKNTHPLIYQYIVENFELVPQMSDSVRKIFKARDKLF